MERISKIKDNIRENILLIRYKKKARQLNIDLNLLEFLIERAHDKKYRDILKLITQSKDKTAFKENILSYCESHNVPLKKALLVGSVIDYYNCFLSYDSIKDNKLSHFQYPKEENIKILNNLRDFAFDYISNNNELKNNFLFNNEGKYDYTLDLSKELILEYFDNFINGKCHIEGNSFTLTCIQKVYKIINDYIYRAFYEYSKDDLLSNFDFFKYDILYNKSNKESIDNRKEKYIKFSKLRDDQIQKIELVQELKIKLRNIDNEYSQRLLKQIDSISNDLEENINILEDIYLEFEILFREDIINHLYTPTNQVTVIENFRELRPQLLHTFIRTTEKFKEDLIEKIKEDIINKRINNKDSDFPLNDSEKIELEKRLNLIERELDQTQVNYFYETPKTAIYTDPSGINAYHSDTSNQISTSLYSENYFLTSNISMIGIGFNHEGLEKEAIALSSDTYITTNKGLNNLEIDYNFKETTSTYEELKKHDGKSEIVIFRRYDNTDTKASYIFVSVSDNNNPSKSEKRLLDMAYNLSKKNNLKLVIYSLNKIKNSYTSYLNNSELENNNKKR